MSVQSTIETKLSNALAPNHLEVLNESHMHSVPPGSESHFKLIIVSDAFDGASRVARHQWCAMRNLQMCSAILAQVGDIESRLSFYRS